MQARLCPFVNTPHPAHPVAFLWPLSCQKGPQETPPSPNWRAVRVSMRPELDAPLPSSDQAHLGFSVLHSGLRQWISLEKNCSSEKHLKSHQSSPIIDGETEAQGGGSVPRVLEARPQSWNLTQPWDSNFGILSTTPRSLGGKGPWPSRSRGRPEPLSEAEPGGQRKRRRTGE